MFHLKGMLGNLLNNLTEVESSCQLLNSNNEKKKILGLLFYFFYE